MRNRRSPALTGIVLVCLLLLQPFVSAQTAVSGSTEAAEASTVTAEGTSVVSQGNGTHGEAKPKDTIAHILDEALKEEFKHEEEKSAEQGSEFNKTATGSDATKETVIIISSKKDRHSNSTSTSEGVSSGNSTTVAEHGSGTGTGTGGSDTSSDGSQQGSDTSASTTTKDELGSQEADVDRIIDSKDNEYVLSKKGEESVMGIMLDPRLVKDLTVLIAASAVLGGAMEALGQPTINGYFLAGSAVGPGGFNWVSEPVQVQSLAQLGVQLLMFSLGLEFSLGKLRAVRGVALLGGALQVVLLAALCSGVAAAIGTDASLGAFVGALAGMSSTSIVVKCLADRRCQHSASGQIVVGTLVVQDCMVGLLFALMPLLGMARRAAEGSGGIGIAVLASVLFRVAAKLAVTALAGIVLGRFVLPGVLSLIARNASAETQQMLAAGACCAAALVTTRLGISAELGAFVAGATLAAAGAGELLHARLAPLTQFFLALFISSTGMVLSPTFLLHHLPVLAAGALIVVIVKGFIVGGVVMAFGYGVEVAAGVGLSLAQVGEFVFVLLSLAHAQELLATQIYLLLMGITALSLLVTPFLLELSTRVGGGQSWMPIPTTAGGSQVEMGGLPVALPPGRGAQRYRASPPPSVLDGQEQPGGKRKVIHLQADLVAQSP